MDLWDHSHPHLLQQPRRSRRDNPSFSSSLLDAIYRSIDESNSQPEEHLIFYSHKTTLTTKHSILPRTVTQDPESLNFRMIDSWMDKKQLRNIRDFTLSSSSSSESSSTAGRRFSSSETEFLSRPLHRPTKLKPKPIKTNTWAQTEIITPNPKHENGFVKSKSKASKIYHDLKKVKQPISPGARLASFLNSLFNGGSPKTKQKISSSTCSINSTKFDYDMSRKSKSQQGSTSTCSSASSFSRSCLSKTPSSRGNIKRSVRFCPVSVIVDEDCRPCGHKFLHKSEEPIMKKVIGIERYREELPVYETTHFKTNCAIAKGLVL
ncbi:hypothetical protein Csa_002199 [Cucumis sativus]|uniref:Protein BIG GRAIN 1-like B n=1 Tax=Cucumis sativus TaxID=3659 RepID=A0A0A0LFP8_CUCSA|nr:hypothetical protein Csa_002199 [Cucumis sativus]